MNAFDLFSPAYIKNEDIDEILNGELAAVRAYDQIEKIFDSNLAIKQIKNIKLEHQQAVNFWRNQADISGFYTEESTSMWGIAVDTLIWISKLMGENTAIKVLIMGEEYGLENYKKKLQSDSLCRTQKLKITNHFIPTQENHIDALKELIH
tara:strand:- start:8730 stop:9182 length:453 start_codon:yes stop_codon:yes gene_type:complete